jgi:hypothetical protein
MLAFLQNNLRAQATFQPLLEIVEKTLNAPTILE